MSIVYVTIAKHPIERCLLCFYFLNFCLFVCLFVFVDLCVCVWQFQATLHEYSWYIFMCL